MNEIDCNKRIAAIDEKIRILEEREKDIAKKSYVQRLMKANREKHSFESLESRAKTMNVKTTKLVAFCVQNHVLMRSGKKPGSVELDATELNALLSMPGVLSSISKIKVTDEEAEYGNGDEIRTFKTAISTGTGMKL